jgi:hypothetical protein
MGQGLIWPAIFTPNLRLGNVRAEILEIPLFA